MEEFPTTSSRNIFIQLESHPARRPSGCYWRRIQNPRRKIKGTLHRATARNALSYPVAASSVGDTGFLSGVTGRPAVLVGRVGRWAFGGGRVGSGRPVVPESTARYRRNGPLRISRIFPPIIPRAIFPGIFNSTRIGSGWGRRPSQAIVRGNVSRTPDENKVNPTLRCCWERAQLSGRGQFRRRQVSYSYSRWDDG